HGRTRDDRPAARAAIALHHVADRLRSALPAPVTARIRSRLPARVLHEERPLAGRLSHPNLSRRNHARALQLHARAGSARNRPYALSVSRVAYARDDCRAVALHEPLI